MIRYVCVRMFESIMSFRFCMCISVCVFAYVRVCVYVADCMAILSYIKKSMKVTNLCKFYTFREVDDISTNISFYYKLELLKK